MKPKAADRHQSQGPGWLTRRLQDHTRAVTETVDRLRARPFATIITSLVIGITLALPASLETMLSNFAGTGQALGQRSMQVSLFLNNAISPTAGEFLAHTLAGKTGIASARYISKQQALKEFKAQSGASNALDLLSTNPLPASIQIELNPGSSQQRILALQQQLSNLPQVTSARTDPQWIRRLYALSALLERIVMLFGIGLSVTVLIVVGNTVRLDMENRRQEIAVMKLLGAPNAYVRRPFLYTGLMYGFVGALLAWILVAIGMASLSDPVQRLAGLYHSDFTLSLPGVEQLSSLLLTGIVLGWAAAFYTVTRHLQRIEPR